MKVFKDVFSGDELCSDSYDQLAPFDMEDLKGVAFEIKTKRVSKGNEDFGIADNSEEDGGGVDSSEETVIDVIDAFRLQETNFSKKDFSTYIKAYMARVKEYLAEKNADRVEKFMNGAKVLIKKILDNFDDYQFFMGESGDIEAGIVYAYYKDGEEAPRLIYILDGLNEVKY